jgi:hypothetical protein
MPTTYAVVGDTNGKGVYGVLGLSKNGDGVHGVTAGSGSAGVSGQSSTGFGVVGAADGARPSTFGGGVGVGGFSKTGIGVVGSCASSGNGVEGLSASGYGVLGDSTSSYGVYGISTNAAGLFGSSRSGVGVEATGGTYGVQASGTAAQLYLVPANAAGAPTSGKHAVGEIVLDKNGALFICVAAGTPGTWKKVKVQVG